MTGRGRPRKAKSPDTKCAKSPTRAEETKQGSLPRCSGRAKEEKQNGTAKEQKPKKRQQKKPNHNEEKPSVQSTQSEKTTKHFTEEIGKQQKTSTDSTKAPVQGTKAKNYARRAKSPEQFTKETMKIQPVLPKCTTVDPVKTTKAKTCGKKAKSTEQFTDKMQPEIPKASVQVTKAKTCAGRTKSPENLTEETTKKQQKSFKSTRQACEPQDKCKDKAGVDSILYTTLDTLKIKKDERSDASKVINNIVRNIMEHLKNNSQSFKEVQEPLRTGSYYENLKISNPDEFDVMLPIPVDRVDIEPFGNDGAFYSVALKRGKSPLTKFQQETGILSASEMLKEFREEVTKCVKTFKGKKDCLKLLKHLLGLLKERGSFDKFCSYHAKTTLLHACCSRTKDTDWQASSLSHCFQMLLNDFEDHLDKGVLNNFFIPTQNLLSGLNQEKCRSLAKCIKDQRNNGFPIFK
eukprot:superscaffoldBa00000247_g3127